MTTLSAAWSELERRQEAADDRYQRELKAHPLSSFLPEAEHYALGEGTPELVDDFQCAHSDVAYRLLMSAAGMADKLEIPDYLERLVIVDQTTWYNFRAGWIAEYAEQLQDARVTLELELTP